MATREENLQKINEELDKLTDEQLEEVAGGRMIRWGRDLRRREEREKREREERERKEREKNGMMNLPEQVEPIVRCNPLK